MDHANPGDNAGDSARLAALCHRMGCLWLEQTIEIFYETQPSREEKEEVISETPQSPTTLMPVEQSQNQQQNEVMEIPAGGNL